MSKKSKTIILIFSIFIMFSTQIFGQISLNESKNKQIKSIISETNKEYNIPKKWLSEQFENLSFNENVIKSIQMPAESKPWPTYEKLLVTSKRVKSGIKFKKENLEYLNAKEKKYSIPQNIIIAILGIETNYGKTLGNIKAIEALATLACYYPPRSTFFKNELKALLKFSYEKSWNLEKTYGSYAGALGMPQFMPSNLPLYALGDTDKNNPEIFNNTKSAINSVFNYLKKAGKWQKNEKIVTKIELSQEIEDNILKDMGKERMKKINIKIAKKIKKDFNPLKERWLLKVDSTSKNKKYQWYIAYPNFKSIMHYNNSSLYALAVTEIADKVQND